MAASTTDVRAWAREQGHDIGVRGAIPAQVREEYERAHAAPPNTVPGEVIDSSMGVTEADFPEDEPEAPAETAAGKPKGRERRPRAVKPPPAKGGFRERIFGGGTPKTKTRSGPRVSLSDWAEETWADLAWLAQPVPPLAKILTIQAPYAGVVFDDQVKGTIVDSMLQPVAKYSGAFRALNGLAGPPVYVGMICAVGARVQVGVTEAGEPVTDYDARTKMLFQGLRYSLLQMTKIAEVKAGEIQARTQASAERMAVVEMMIASIFGFEDAPAQSPAAAYEPRAQPDANGYAYPSAPTMDGTGADPGRL